MEINANVTATDLTKEHRDAVVSAALRADS
jgi:hypothetical protein